MESSDTPVSTTRPGRLYMCWTTERYYYRTALKITRWKRLMNMMEFPHVGLVLFALGLT